MAGQLTQRWNQTIWGQVVRILARPEDFAPEHPPQPRRPRQHQRRFPKSFWDQVIAEYQAGASATSLKEFHGVDDETIRNQLRKRGITPRPQKPPTFTGTNLQEAQALRANGATYTEIGKKFGVNRQTVANALNKTKD
jgi:transposase-like protein